MHILDGCTDFFDIFFHLLLRNRLFIELLIGVRSEARLKQEVDIIGISSKTIKSNYVWMIHE